MTHFAKVTAQGIAKLTGSPEAQDKAQVAQMIAEQKAA